MSVSVKVAAEQLGVSEPRVRQMIASGALSAERFGRSWMISAEDVARLQGQSRRRGRPLGPSRAWGLIDMLGGGRAPWLKPVARSQLRRSLERFDGGDADRWRAGLRGRSDVRYCIAHPAAIKRMVPHDSVLPAGPIIAAGRGFDLVALGDGVSELYAKPERWERLAKSLAIRAAGHSPANLVVRLPLLPVWPFGVENGVSDAALAADLLESPEPRAVSAAVEQLNDMLARRLRRYEGRP